jgi:hypothetical protein
MSTMIESKIDAADTDVVQASFMAVGTFLQQSGERRIS